MDFLVEVLATERILRFLFKICCENKNKQKLSMNFGGSMVSKKLESASVGFEFKCKLPLAESLTGQVSPALEPQPSPSYYGNNSTYHKGLNDGSWLMSVLRKC